MNSIAENISRIRSRLGHATLIAASKGQDCDKIKQAIEAGQRHFGENYVQEAMRKFPALRAKYPDVVLHLIGALQSNKAQDAVELFDVIQTVDRMSVARALAKAIDKTGRRPRLYIQVNIGHEPQKAGIAMGDVEGFLAACRSLGLQISGLMCVPPQGRDPCGFFTAMRALADRFALPHLSMGMSADYPSAIACGATEVRIGSAIFGARLGRVIT